MVRTAAAEWQIKAGEQDFGTYLNRSDAIRAAAEAASGAARKGQEIEILAQIENPSIWEKIGSAAAGRPVAAE
ncbi:MAG: hypothetical protein IT562_15855 [Alphaproteobacteria bacterium]|nr:hypothetical protein [Alphaproteobacteria bacterium]